eukprot:3114590-Karenia_brevis.AAC.1
MLEAKMNVQTTHDARYYKSIDAGVAHHKAWYEEKKRRRSALKGAKDERDSRIERIRLERESGMRSMTTRWKKETLCP